MKEDSKIAVIVINWNGKKYLKECLSAIYNQSFKNYVVYFVDNGSTDGSVEYVKKNFPRTKIVALKENKGFAEGNNIGIRIALKDEEIKGIICLNNDTIVSKNWLKALVKTAEMSDRIGMVSSMAVFSDGQIQNAGLSLERALQNNCLGGISLGYGKKNVASLNEEREIFAPCGVAAFYKRKMLKEIGLFDEDFFIYAEDLDLGFRGRLAGWKCYLSPKARLVHLHSKTMTSFSFSKIYLQERNRYFTAIKNLPLKFLIEFFYYDLLLKLKQLFSKGDLSKRVKKRLGKTNLIKLFLKIYFSVILGTPKMIKKRLKIRKNIKVSSSIIEQWFTNFSRETIEINK